MEIFTFNFDEYILCLYKKINGIQEDKTSELMYCYGIEDL
jgi:hypothetical protein